MGISARPARAVILFAWAGFFLLLWLGGEADRYLGPRTTWVAPFGALTLALAAIGYGLLTLRGASERRLTRFEATGHFVLLVPILAVVLVPRAELGAQAARKKDTNRSLASVQLGPAKKAAAKAAAAAAVQQKNEIAKIDFVSLASLTTDPGYARDIGVQTGTRVRFVGFAVRTGRSDRFRLARFLISCCAADAVPVFIDVKVERAPIPPDNAWLEVTGSLVKQRGAFLVAAESLKRVDEPSNPYVTMKW